MTEFEDDFGEILLKCGNDANIFLTHNAAFLKKRIQHFDNAAFERILNKFMECPSTTPSPTNENPQQSIDSSVHNQLNTINTGQSFVEKFGAILVPATQHSSRICHEDESSLVIDETVNDTSVQSEELDDEIFVPETQYVADDSASDVGSRRHSWASSCYSIANIAIEERAAADDVDEFNHVEHEMNTSLPTAVDDPAEKSQAIMDQCESELTFGIITQAHIGNETTDSRIFSTPCGGNDSKIDAKTMELDRRSDAATTGQSNLLDTNRPAASVSTRLEIDRSTSVTPDLDIFSDMNAAAIAIITSIDVQTSTPDLYVTNSLAPQVYNAKSTAERIQKLFGAGTSLSHQAQVNPSTDADTFEIEINLLATVPTNDDCDSNESHDNELFGAATQVFPPPAQINSIQPSMKADISAKKINDKAAAPTADENAMQTDCQQNDGVADEADDEDSNGAFSVQTQVFPKPTPVLQNQPAGDSKGNSNGGSSSGSSKENSPNKSSNSGMGPPELPSKSHRTSCRKSNPSGDIFATPTQEFVPLLASSSTDAAVDHKNDAAAPATSVVDDIYAIETQILPTTIASLTPATLSDIWPTTTPVLSVAAKIPPEEIEKGQWSRKKQKIEKKRWLFDDSSDGSSNEFSDAAKTPKETKKKRPEKRKLASAEPTPPNIGKKTKVEQRTYSNDAYIPSSAELARIKKRRVSVVLERMNFDINSNVSTPSRNVERTPNRIVSALPRTSETRAKRNKQTNQSPMAEAKTPNNKNEGESRQTETKTRSTKKSASKRLNSDISSDRNTRSSSRPKIAFNSLDLALEGDSRSGLRSTSRTGLRSTRSRSDSHNSNPTPKHRIMFTKVDLERSQLKQAIECIPQMGGEVVDCPTMCTVLVCEKIYRTNKMLSSINQGITIVTPNWLLDSHKRKRFVDCEPYQVHDATNEQRFNFNLKISLEIAKGRPLFRNWIVFTTPSTIPPPKEIAMIVECGGGKCTTDCKQELTSKNQKLVVSDTNDARLWKKYRGLHPAIPIINTEGFMRMVLQQHTDFSGYKLCK